MSVMVDDINVALQQHAVQNGTNDRQNIVENSTSKNSKNKRKAATELLQEVPDEPFLPKTQEELVESLNQLNNELVKEKQKSGNNNPAENFFLQVSSFPAEDDDTSAELAAALKNAEEELNKENQGLPKPDPLCFIRNLKSGPYWLSDEAYEKLLEREEKLSKLTNIKILHHKSPEQRRRVPLKG